MGQCPPLVENQVKKITVLARLVCGNGFRYRWVKNFVGEHQVALANEDLEEPTKLTTEGEEIDEEDEISYCQ